MTAAPLHSPTVEAVHVTRKHSAVVLLADESPELREWLWPAPGIYRGKATGSRFRLTVDGVSVDIRRVFVRPAQDMPKVYLVATTGPADTGAAALGRKVGRPVHEVELARVSAGKRQGELAAKAAGPKRITVEVVSADALA